MTARNLDKKNRFRNITVGFRVSPEENEKLNRVVAVSGLAKQEYCYRKCMDMKVEVRGNPKVYKALKDQMAQILAELQRIETGQEADEELLEITKFVAEVVGGMKEEKTQFPSIADGGPRDSSASIWDTQTHKRGGR